MPTSKGSPREIAPARYCRLFDAVSRGDVVAASAQLDGPPSVYLLPHQATPLVKACVLAPRPVSHLALIHERSDTLFRGTTSYLGTALMFACEYRADVATVEYIVKCLNELSLPELESVLVSTTTTRNTPHVLRTAIQTNDQTFLLRFMGLPAVQAFLASLEASFDPCFIRPVATYPHPQEWLFQAMARNVHAVVAMAAERCPLVTAEVAWMHCASNPVDASKYADLCVRREWLSRQIEVFHQAIQAGNSDVVRSMLEEVPALRRSRMDNDVTALMASAVAPNSIALLECLLDAGTTNKAVVQALVHACEHGAAAASIDHLWNWVQFHEVDDRRRDRALWEAITSAASSQNVLALRVLLPHVRDWKIAQVRDLITRAIKFQNEDYVCGIMELPVVEAYFATLKDKGNMTVVTMNLDSKENECDCTGECACAFAVDIAISDWIDNAVRHGLRRVTSCLDKWWPALTRRVAFMQCNESSTYTAVWSHLSQQYARDVTWCHTRDAYLVQRRVLPGLDHLSERIATYLYVFDTQREYFQCLYSYS